MPDFDPIIPIDNNEAPQDAFLIFPLYDGDRGSAHGRSSRTEFKTRRPLCLRSFDDNGVVCEISNLGTLPSDLIVLEHQFVFCTLPAHGAGDGFTAIHAGEVTSAPVDAIINAAYVPARSSIEVHFPLPRVSLTGLANIYFRSRIGTLWSPAPPMRDWDFAQDPHVVEAHRRLAP